MHRRVKTTLALAAAATLAAPAVAQNSGPVATYWVSAATSSGMGAGMGQMGSMGGPQQQASGRGGSQQQQKPKRPGLGALIGAAAQGALSMPGMAGGRVATIRMTTPRAAPWPGAMAAG
jgi:hypothetical protein